MPALHPLKKMPALLDEEPSSSRVSGYTPTHEKDKREIY